MKCVNMYGKNSVPNAWARFLMIEGTDPAHPLQRLSIFAVNKFLEGVSPDFGDVKHLRDGSLLVQCKSQKASDRLLKRSGSVVVNCQIRVSPHKGLNSCKGVIRCRELRGLSEVEIRTELKDQGVTEVHRVTTRKGADRVPTDTFFLTFCVSSLPASIKVGWLNVKVSLFVPSPVRCFNCNRFGHVGKHCKHQKKCVKCGEDSHEGECSGPLKCTNCKGDHPANSKECPIWKFESAIQRVRAEQKVGYSEAKKIAEAQTGTSFTFQKSFAAVAKKTLTTIACQTDITWLKQEKPVQVCIRPVVRPSGGGRSTTGTQATSKPVPSRVAPEGDGSSPRAGSPSASGASRRPDSVPSTPGVGGAGSKPIPAVGTSDRPDTAPSTSKVDGAVSKPCPPPKPPSDQKNKYASKKLVTSDRVKKAEQQLINTYNRYLPLSEEDDMSS